MLTLPGLIDPHVHMREPGQTQKEDWYTGTCAALAGGFTYVLAMPNTKPPVTDFESLEEAKKSAKPKAVCDYGQFLGAGSGNTSTAAALATTTCGMKMYLDLTFGPLHLADEAAIDAHFANWPASKPIVIHAELPHMEKALQLAAKYNRSLHVAHVSRADEILLIRKAKEGGQRVTCEVTPHHLFLTEEDAPRIGPGRSEVRPVLNTKTDQLVLWENLAAIDCFATDHAPHLLSEKDGDNPPPGFPGLETSFALFLQAVKDGRMTLEDVLLRMHNNPQRIFGLPPQLETFVHVDLEYGWTVRGSGLKTHCGWSPFEGMPLKGKVIEVTLRGEVVYRDGAVLANPGSGRDAFAARKQ